MSSCLRAVYLEVCLGYGISNLIANGCQGSHASFPYGYADGLRPLLGAVSQPSEQRYWASLLLYAKVQPHIAVVEFTDLASITELRRKDKLRESQVPSH